MYNRCLAHCGPQAAVSTVTDNPTTEMRHQTLSLKVSCVTRKSAMSQSEPDQLPPPWVPKHTVLPTLSARLSLTARILLRCWEVGTTSRASWAGQLRSSSLRHGIGGNTRWSGCAAPARASGRQLTSSHTSGPKRHGELSNGKQRCWQLEPRLG